MPSRASSGYLLETPQATILFDCGDGVTGSFLRLGKTPGDVDLICISHTHPDHICGLGYFIQQMYLANRQHELTIYLPGEAVEGIKSYMALNYLFLNHFPFAIDFQRLTGDRKLSCGDVSIIPHGNTHLTKHRGQPWMAAVDNRGQCFSFEIHLASQKIVYSADVGSLADLHFCKGCDILLVETTHIDMPELIECAEAWKTKTLVLTHIGPDFDPRAISAAGKYFSGQILVAEDGMAIPLDS